MTDTGQTAMSESEQELHRSLCEFCNSIRDWDEPSESITLQDLEKLKIFTDLVNAYNGWYEWKTASLSREAALVEVAQMFIAWEDHTCDVPLVQQHNDAMAKARAALKSPAA